ncbi:MAG: hypothetical protein H6740_08165 [Alphaproteobacteria bacterium]|nr:hypothetical protein [Alphaproteobacteria bacterium]
MRRALFALTLLLPTTLLAQDEPAEAPEAATEAAPEAPPPAPEKDALTLALEEASTKWWVRDAKGVTAKVIGELEAQVTANPNNYQLRVELARWYYWWASHSGGGDLEAQRGKKGWDHAKEAQRINPSGVEGFYWAAANVGAYSRGMGIMTAVKEGLSDEFKANGMKAIEIDKNYDNAGPLRAMGRYYFKLPWPLYDGDEARKYLEQAVNKAPNSAINRFYLAELEVEDGNKDAARAQCEAVAQIDPKVHDPPSTRENQKKCLELIEGL